MDLWAVHVSNTHPTPTPILLRNPIHQKLVSWNLNKLGSFRADQGRASEIRALRRNVSRFESMVIRAIGKKNHDSSNSSSSGKGDQPIPGDSAEGNNSSSGNNRSDDATSQKSHCKDMNWREFRAALLENEKAEAGSHHQDMDQRESKPLGQKWAHPISSPETGCLLVATEKLDGVRTFERTVVLLLRTGSRHPQEGPFGIVINRPLHKKIKDMKPTNPDLATTFANCPLHFGGPLEASMYLSKTGGKKPPTGFAEVIPGLCFGARNSLDQAANLVKKGALKPQDFKFFVGYAGWQLDQLREEIESDYWYIAACSENLIFEGSATSEGLWEEILQLMGGHYSELSRKPKQDI